MKLYDVISVDPSKITLGALHPEAAKMFLRKKVITQNYAKKSRKTFLNLFFACLAPGVERFGCYMLAFRALFAALMIVSGSFILYGEIASPESVMPSFSFAMAEIILGGMLALGLASRLAMATSTLIFGIISCSSVISGAFDMQSMLCLLGSIIFLTLGAGKFSLDFIIRKSIISDASRRKQNSGKQRLSYKAIHYTGQC